MEHNKTIFYKDCGFSLSRGSLNPVITKNMSYFWIMLLFFMNTHGTMEKKDPCHSFIQNEKKERNRYASASTIS